MLGVRLTGGLLNRVFTVLKSSAKEVSFEM